jgi:predicted thioesterase
MVYRRPLFVVVGLCLWALTLPVVIAGQTLGSAGEIAGTVSDPSGAVIPGATVTIINRVSSFERTASTDSAGRFSITNVPFNPYHLTVSATGFATHVQDIDVGSAVLVNLKIAMELGSARTTVTVSSEAADLIETDPTTHTDVDRASSTSCRSKVSPPPSVH